jgi:hypothetical protein
MYERFLSPTERSKALHPTVNVPKLDTLKGNTSATFDYLVLFRVASLLAAGQT